MPAPKDLNKYKNTVSVVDDEGTKKQGGFTTKVDTNSGLVKTGSFANKVDTTKTSGVPVTYTNANNVQNTGNNARTVTVTTGTPLNVNQTATQPTNTVATTPTVTAGVPTIATASQPVQSNQPSNVVSYMPSSTANTTTTREKPTYAEPVGTRESAKTPIDYKSIQSTYTPTQVSANTAKFEPSQQYLDAMASVQASLDKLMSGRTSYTDKINSSLKSIEDTAPFSYDFNSDPMFQQMLAGAMKSGKLAMEDSMGQAAALTGGYGSSYSGMVGQQAYNRYIDEAYDRIPDYWGMALSEYQQDLNNKYNLLNQYRASDDTEWNRNFDTFKSQYQMASDQWDRESNTYWNEQNFNENSRQWAESENDNRNRFAEAIRQYENDMAYQQYRDSVSDQQYDNALAYQQYRDAMSDYYKDRDYDYQLSRDAVNDYRYNDETAYARAIDERNFNYNAGQDSIANALKQAQLNYNMSQDAKELQYKYDLMNYNKEQDALDRQYKYDALNWDKEQANAKTKAAEEDASKLKDPTPKQFEEAWNAYKEGGVEGLDAYYMTLPGVNLVQLEQYVGQMNDNQYVNRQYSSNGDLGVKNNITRKTDRLNSNMVVYDQNNNKYTLGELAQLIADQEGISVTQAKDIIREMDITNNQATLNDFLRLASNIASNKAKSLK